MLCFFDPAMQAAASARSALEGDIRLGLARAEFLLHYQPVVNATGQLLGAEALVRWNHPQRGMVPPAEFIPLAEQTGLILPLGRQVLAMACHQLALWAADPARASWTLSVNVSAQEFRQSEFVQDVLAVLRDSGADARRLKLELTESLLLHDVEDSILKMQALRTLGVGFALDDFGTGYSSLSYLKRLPLDQLKIDQSFVRDVLTDPNDAAIACTIITLAHSLALDVVAEGVETEGQRAFLLRNGCQRFQGYLFGRPGPAALL
jgi:EAL domain-containing protein (putative c-di-GMP-specific phosphodiesterase class I)